METTTGTTRRPNKRGVLAREKLLSTALQMLASGRPETASVNLIAKEAGLSWGSVQNLFGDSDGFWAAVVTSIADEGASLWAEPTSTSVSDRVAEMMALYRRVLDSPHAIAIETIRGSLPRHADALNESHPLTAAAMARLDALRSDAFARFLDGLDISKDDAAVTAALISSALRGLRADETVGVGVDADRAAALLAASLGCYLESKRS